MQNRPPPQKKKRNPMLKLYIIFLFCVCVFTDNYALFKQISIFNLQRNLFWMFSLVDNIYSVKSEGMVFILCLLVLFHVSAFLRFMNFPDQATWCFASWLKISFINLILENNVACDFQSQLQIYPLLYYSNRPVFLFYFNTSTSINVLYNPPISYTSIYAIQHWIIWP